MDVLSKKPNRVSNGPIEAHYKNLKNLVLEDQKNKLGRFVRQVDKYYRSLATDIDITFLYDKLYESVAVGTKVNASKKNKKPSKSKVFGKESNKDLKMVTESWNKKKTQIPPNTVYVFAGIFRIAETCYDS